MIYNYRIIIMCMILLSYCDFVYIAFILAVRGSAIIILLLLLFINFVEIKVIMNLVITYISAKINFIRVCVHGYDLYVSLYS